MVNTRELDRELYTELSTLYNVYNMLYNDILLESFTIFYCDMWFVQLWPMISCQTLTLVPKIKEKRKKEIENT